MVLEQQTPGTWRLDVPWRISAELSMPRWLQWDEAQTDWLMRQVRQFAAGQDFETELDAGVDQLRLLFGGNDFEPTLIVQNTHVGGQSRGTVYLKERQAQELAAELERLLATRRAQG